MNNSTLTRNTVLFWVLVPVTILVLTFTLLEFHKIGGVKVDPLLSLSYVLMLSAYASDNGFKRELKVEKKKRRGQWFVYMWAAVGLYMGIVSSFPFGATMQVPEYHEKLLLFIGGLFGVTTVATNFRNHTLDWIRKQLAPAVEKE